MSHESTSITLVRSFDVPVDRVFAAWVDPELMRAWFAPRSVLIRDVEAQPRMGGHYLIRSLDARGTYHVTRGEYIEVVPNRRIAKTWITERLDAPSPIHATRLSIDFRKTPAGAGTEITLCHEDLRSGVEARARQRWTECLDRLEELFDLHPGVDGGPNAKSC